MQEKTHTYAIRTITDLKPGDHICQIYEAEEEHRKLLTPYLIQGLRNNEKVLYIVDTHTAEVILEYLNSEGFDPKPYLDSGQFSIITRNESYVKEGNFDPDRMIELLRSETQKAIKEGYGALRVTGEMTWALRGLPGSEKLIEYEAKLNDFFPGSKALAICQYDRNQFSPEILLNILRTHPIAVIGTEICDNPFYVPAKAFLGPNVYEATLDSWTNNLLERKKAESKVRLSEEKFAEVFNDSPSAVYITTFKEGRFIEINKSAVNMFGYTLDEIVGRTSKELNLWADISDRNALILSLLKDGAVHGMEVRLRRKSGLLFPALISVEFIDVEDERCLLSTAVDLTERNEALRKIKLFSDAMQYSLNLVLTADLRGNVTYVNPAFEKVWGYSQEETSKMKIKDFLAEEEAEKVEKQIIPAIIDQGGFAGEAIARHKSGSKFPVTSVAHLFKGEDHSAVICASFTDISERKQAEEMLRESEEKYRIVVEGALDGICVIGGDYRFKYVNEKLAEIQGCTREELIGTDLRDYLDEESRTLLADRAAQQEKGIKLSARFQLNTIRKDGEVRTTEISARNIKDSKGDVNTIVILKDITERKKAEESLRTSEARYRSYIELTGQIGWTTPAEGMVDDIPAWRKFTGQSIEEVKGWGWVKALHPDDVEHTKQVWDKAVETKTNYETEYRIRRYDGVYRDFVARGIPVLKEDRNIREWVGTCIDITERKKAEEALRESEESYRIQFEQTIDALFLADTQTGIILDCNKAAMELIGREKSEMVGQHQRILHPSEEADRKFSKSFKQHINGETLAETKIIKKSGEIRDAAIKASTFDLKGKKVILAIFRDITERKQTEEKIKELVQEWERTFQSISDLIFIQNNDHTILRVNNAFAATLKMAPENIVGKKCYELLHKTNSPWPDCPFERTKKDKASHSHEVDDVNIGIPLLVTTSPIFNNNGVLVGSVHSAKDITEPKKAEKELKASKANFLNIVENSIDGILVVDPQGKIHYVNPVAESLFLGKKGKLWGEMFGFPLVADEMVEIDIFRKNAGKGVAEMRSREIEWEGKPAYLVSIRDVTETKEAEQLKAAMNERRRIDKAKDDFISTVSHELRTPLTTIKEFTSIISDEIPGKLTKDQKEYVDIIKGNVDRLARLINDILDISKIESGRIGLARAFADINKLADGVISTLRPEANKKHVALKSLFHTPLPNVYIDPDKMIQVFTNLIENAIKFTPENGEITVEIEDKKTHIECSVADTGRGIAPENLQKLFTRFQQFDRVPGPGAKGTGLGLAITKELIKLHNGTIWAESILDKGSKFIFTIPRETELSYLKEILSSKIIRIASSGETLALLFIDILNFDELKENLDKDNLVRLIAIIKDITSATLRKTEDVILPLEEKRMAAVSTVKNINGTKAVMDRLKSALQIKLLLNKDFEVKVRLCISAVIYGELIDSVDKMIEGTSKIREDISISLIGKREIVVVDDEEVILKSVKSYLEQAGDYRVYAYSNPVKALEQIILIRPEIVIMDINMPQMSGYELVGRLYSHKGFEEIPVIFISGSDFDDKQLENIVSKKVGMLKKPFSVTELLDKINTFSIPEFEGLNAENGRVKS